MVGVDRGSLRCEARSPAQRLLLTHRQALLRRAGPAVLLLVLLLAGTSPVDAAFPGRNGRLVYSLGNGGRGGRAAIVLSGPAGGRRRALTAGETLDISPRWAPRGGRLAFTRITSDDTCRIVIIDARGHRLRTLPAAARCDSSPAWSPDGRRLVFERQRRDGSGGHDLWISSANGHHQRRLTRPQGDDRDPSWSVRNQIVFWRVTSTGAQIDVIAPGAREPRDLSPAPGDYHPDWSPDGRRLAFARLSADGTSLLFVMGADGRHRRDLGPVPSDRPTDPHFSPDGRCLVFTSYTEARSGIGVLVLDSRRLHRFAFPAAQAQTPDWQPRPGPRARASHPRI